MSGWGDWGSNVSQQITNGALSQAASDVAPSSPILEFILGKVLAGSGGALDDGPSQNPFTGSLYADPFTTEVYGSADPFITGTGSITEVISIGDGPVGEASSDAQAAVGYDGHSPLMLASPDLLAQNDAAPANASVASDAGGAPVRASSSSSVGAGTVDDPIVIYDNNGAVVAYEYVDENGVQTTQPVDREEGSELIRFPDDPLNAVPPSPNSVQQATPPPQFPQLTPNQLAQLNTAIQQAVGPSVPSAVDAGQPPNINDVLAGSDWASPDSAQNQPAVSPPPNQSPTTGSSFQSQQADPSQPGSGTVPFNPMADSPFASWLLYRNNTPILDALTSDSNLRAAQNASLALATAAATVATAGAILGAAPAIAAGVQSFFAGAATGAQSLWMSALPLGAGALGTVAANPALQQEIGDELENLPALSNEVGALANEVDALAPETEENLAATAEQALTKFQDIVRQAQAFLNANKDIIMELGGSSRGAPISPNQLGAAIGQYAEGNPGFARVLGGNAMEALVNAIIEDLPPGEGSFLQISGPNRIDFIGTGAFEGYAFELTTEAGVIGHAVRAYMQTPGAMIITYPPIIE